MELNFRFTEKMMAAAFEKAMQNIEVKTGMTLEKCVEKQVPRKLWGNKWNPVHVGDTVSGFCPVCMTEFVCATPIMYKANNYGYCKACGQKLDWSGEENG